MHKVSYVLAEKFTQDPLETYLGKQYFEAYKDKIPFHDFASDSTILKQKVFKQTAIRNVGN